MKIEIDSIQELKDFLALFMPVRPVHEGPMSGPAVGEEAVKKARAKPSEKPASAPQPETAAEAAPEPEAAQTASPEPEAKAEAKAEEKPKGKPKKITRDDVVQAFRGYIDRFGQKAAMTDVTVLLKRGFDVSMIKEIPDGEENFKKAIKIVTEAININEFNREAVQ